VAEADALTVAIGDATGHGAKAGTMVTVIKTLFSAYAGESPKTFLTRADDNIKRMELGRMSMALSLARVTVNKLTVASAGMPPVLVHRAATSEIEELAIEATPLGTIGSTYDGAELALAKGDTILFMTDGLPELTNTSGAQLGYPATLDAFARVASRDVQGVISGLVDTARAWHGEQPPNDDMTFVVVRVA
jgi:serine phosphatase RsbU (regulator of sigma subunit)